MTAGAKPFKLHYNMSSKKARQPWEKVMKAQLMQAPWEDVFRNTHTLRLLPKLGTPSVTASFSTFKWCLDVMLEKFSSTTS